MKTNAYIRQYTHLMIRKKILNSKLSIKSKNTEDGKFSAIGTYEDKRIQKENYWRLQEQNGNSIQYSLTISPV